MSYEDYEEDETDRSYHKEQNRKDYYSEDISMSGSTGSFQCPACGSYNTAQGVYFDECRTCGWGQGY